MPILDLQKPRVFSVGEVTLDIKRLLTDNFSGLWVSGEISNFKLASSGHVYFTLKDSQAQISAVMFRESYRLLKFAVEEGLGILAFGRITVYEPRGQYQIIVETIEPQGVGALQLAFEQLKEKLSAEGLFAPEYKKPIPYLPQKIGIITSLQGAVLQDIRHIINRRYPTMNLLIYPVRVQGKGSEIEIAEAIIEMNRQKDIDVLIVARGGGSLEDLWSFNEEVVVRAVFESKIPVISAVGHETDYTLCDLVADLRAPTPSAAAELVAPEKEELVYQVSELQSSLFFALKQLFRQKREKLLFLQKQVRHPRDILQAWKLKLDDLSNRLLRSLEFSHLKIRHVYERLAERLNGVSPYKPLERGYSLVFKENENCPLKKAENVMPGDILNIRLFSGGLKVKVL